MKRLLTIIGNSTLILAAVSCTIGALVSAYSFTVEAVVMFITWAVTALVLSVQASIWRIKGLLVLLVPIIALIIWQLQEIIEGAMWALFYITNEYSKWLYVPILFPDAEAPPFELTIFFTAVGVVIAFLLAIAICLRRSTFLTILFTAPIVFLTFVLVFFQPEPVFLLGLLAVYLTMLLSNGFHADDFSKRGTAVFPALALTGFFMAIAFFLAPPGSYNREGTVITIDNQIRQFVSRTGLVNIKSGFGWPVVFHGLWGFNTSDVGISEAGTRVITDQSLLEVTVSEAGIFYLRGFSMQHFEKGRWTVNSDTLLPYEDSLARGLPALRAFSYFDVFRDVDPVIANMTIERTGDVTRNVLYTPYYVFPFTWDASPYDFSFLYVEDSILDLYSQVPPDYSFFYFYDFSEIVRLSEEYLQIEESTAEGLRKIAVDAGIFPDADRWVISEQVAEYLSSFGRYTLSPFIIPDSEDFALYFLQTSKQGYCIHYATTATLMLRALGVPARFTSGFVVNASQTGADQTIVITDRNAHAWVEVFYDEVGWLPLEVSPPATGFGLPDGRPPVGGGDSPPSDEQDYIDPDPLYPDPVMDPEQPDQAGQASGAGAGGGAGEALIISRSTGGFITGGVIVIVFLSLALRGVVSRKNREQRFAQDSTNAAVIYTWRYLTRLNRLRRGEQLPKEIEDIALKARFSQHCLSEDERSAVVGYANEFAGKIYQSRSRLGRLWVKYVRGL